MRFGILTLTLLLLAGSSPAADIPPSDATVLTGLLSRHIERYAGFIDTSPGIPVILDTGDTPDAAAREFLEAWFTSRGAVIDRSGVTGLYRLSVAISEAVVIIQRDGGTSSRTVKLTITSTLRDSGGTIFDGATTTELYTDEYDTAFAPSTDDSRQFMPDIRRMEIDRQFPRTAVASLLVILGVLAYFATIY